MIVGRTWAHSKVQLVCVTSPLVLVLVPLVSVAVNFFIALIFASSMMAVPAPLAMAQLVWVILE